MYSTGKFYHTLMEEIKPIIYNFFQNSEAEGILLAHSLRPGLP